jgi:VWFA-related protein
MTRRALLLALAGCASARPLVAQSPTFSSRRETVRVDVLVTDHGQPVRNLGIADFEVFDAGVPQTLDRVSFEQLPINVIFALDASASVSGDRLEHLRDGGRAVLDTLKPDDQAALLTFAHGVAARERLTTDAQKIRASLDALTPATSVSSGGTALVDAAFAALTVAESDAGRSLLIVFTDGVETSSWLSPARVLDAARRANLVAYAVSTGRLAKESFLRDLSDLTGGSVMEIGSTDRLRAAFVTIVNEFRQRYLASFSPEGAPMGGWHPLTVRVKGRGNLMVKARAGYVR